MSKFDRAYEMFVNEGGKDQPRKEFITRLQHVLDVSASNASVYAYKCKKKFEDGDSVKAAAVAPKNEETTVVQVQKVYEEAPRKPFVVEVPDCVPDFLLKADELKARRKQANS